MSANPIQFVGRDSRGSNGAYYNCQENIGKKTTTDEIISKTWHEYGSILYDERTAAE
jgi:hypothetical protein